VVDKGGGSTNRADFMVIALSATNGMTSVVKGGTVIARKRILDVVQRPGLRFHSFFALIWQ
jgi:hypothetical protein